MRGICEPVGQRRGLRRQRLPGFGLPPVSRLGLLVGFLLEAGQQAGWRPRRRRPRGLFCPFPPVQSGAGVARNPHNPFLTLRPDDLLHAFKRLGLFLDGSGGEPLPVDAGLFPRHGFRLPPFRFPALGRLALLDVEPGGANGGAGAFRAFGPLGLALAFFPFANRASQVAGEVEDRAVKMALDPAQFAGGSSDGKATSYSRATQASLRFSASSAAFHSAARLLAQVGALSGNTISADSTPPLRV